MPNPIVEYLMRNPGHAFNTGLGGLAAALKTRSLPSGFSVENGDPRITFTGKEGMPPMAMGDVLVQPEGGMTDRSLAHENVHQGQSKDLGFGYAPLSMLGGYAGPLEHEALKQTMGTGGNPDDDIADRFALQDAEKASMDSKLQNILYRMYYGR